MHGPNLTQGLGVKGLGFRVSSSLGGGVPNLTPTRGKPPPEENAAAVPVKLLNFGTKWSENRGFTVKFFCIPSRPGAADTETTSSFGECKPFGKGAAPRINTPGTDTGTGGELLPIPVVEP